jgi:hypothetical protein
MAIASQDVSINKALHHASSRRDNSLATLEADGLAAQLRRELKSQESAIKSAIANETGEDGKPAYSNSEKREAEFLRRADASTELELLRADIEQTERRSAEFKINSQFHADCVLVLCAYGKREG